MKFKPDIDMEFISGKFMGFTPKIASKAYNSNEIFEKTFCIDNKLFSEWLNNENEYCNFFNKYKGGAIDWFWGYAYNLMFEVIDFDYDTDIWLCKVLGYIE